MGDHVFVSYAREDAAYVSRLVTHLQEQGVSPWTDAALRFGVEWPEAIAEHIDTCAAFVLVMSPAARASSWVRREVLRAQDRSKPIFPLLLSGEPLFAVSDLQFEDVTDRRMPSPRWSAHLVEASVTDNDQASILPPAPRRTAPAPARPRGISAQVSLILDNGHSDWVMSVAYSPNGRQLATGSRDDTIRLWDVATDQTTATLTGHTAPVRSVAYSPDRLHLATGSDDRTARLWDLA